MLAEKKSLESLKPRSIAAASGYMKRVVYSSAARAAIDERALTDILAIARVRNARRDLTGMLLYRDGVFLQLLEGREVEVDLVMNSIRQDPRHQRITVLFEEKIAARAFPSWSMAYRVLPSVESDGSAVRPMKEIARDAPYALRLLLQFAEPAPLVPLSTTNALKRAALRHTAD